MAVSNHKILSSEQRVAFVEGDVREVRRVYWRSAKGHTGQTDFPVRTLPADIEKAVYAQCDALDRMGA